MGSVVVHDVSQPTVSQKVNPGYVAYPFYKFGWACICTSPCACTLICYQQPMQMVAEGVAICTSHSVMNHKWALTVGRPERPDDHCLANGARRRSPSTPRHIDSIRWCQQKIWWLISISSLNWMIVTKFHKTFLRHVHHFWCGVLYPDFIGK